VTDAFEAGMAAWWHEHAENREQSVHPEPTEFGIDLDEVRGLFTDYVARLDGWTRRA
jgi:hypothetical protein